MSWMRRSIHHVETEDEFENWNMMGLRGIIATDYAMRYCETTPSTD